LEHKRVEFLQKVHPKKERLSLHTSHFGNISDAGVVTSLCKLLNEPRTLQDAIIENAMNFQNHIVVITGSFDILSFLSTLRGSSLTDSEFKSIVILAHQLPNSGEFLPLSHFADIFFMRGDPENAEEALRRAGIENASKVVIMQLAGDSDDQNDEDYVDSTSVFLSHTIQSMFPDGGPRCVLHGIRKQ
jgi:hypothetical protein